jgi:CelD/BcsL family acetyltransferase involved in cellulose biosynthesis
VGRRVIVATTEDAVLEMRDAWHALPASRPDADLDYFLAIVRNRPEVERPHVVVVQTDGIPSAMLIGRIERLTLDTRIGYHNVYRPKVRSMTIVHGGITTGSQVEDIMAIRASLAASLKRREADLVWFPSLAVDSPAVRVFGSMAGPLRRQHLLETRFHRRLTLPDEFDAFLASRSRKTRFGIRYDTKNLLDAFGDELRVELAREPSDFARVMAQLPSVAANTYQHALGASFADSQESRSLARIALDRGWFRAWILHRGDRPIAFWQGLVYDRTYYSGTTGFDPEYRRYRVGIYLLMKAIEDLCSDPDVEIFDFGLGDAEYKRQFASESWEERDVIVFAPTLRGVGTNWLRTIVLLLSTLARGTLERAGMAAWVKTRWRRRLIHPKL